MPISDVKAIKAAVKKGDLKEPLLHIRKQRAGSGTAHKADNKGGSRR